MSGHRRREIENLFKIIAGTNVKTTNNLRDVISSFQMNSKYQNFKANFSKKFPKKEIYYFINCLNSIRFNEEALYWLITANETYGWSGKKERFYNFVHVVEKGTQICCLDYDLAQKVFDYVTENLRIFETTLEEVFSKI